MQRIAMIDELVLMLSYFQSARLHNGNILGSILIQAQLLANQAESNMRYKMST